MSSLIPWEPFGELRSLRERMDRLFEDAARGWAPEEGLSTGLWAPAVDVYETQDSIVLQADLPHVKQQEVQSSLQGHTLTIRGERKHEKEIKEKDYHRMERSYGVFTPSFTLPGSVDAGKIEATFHNGVLSLSLPKREESKPKLIKIKAGGNAR